jgi:hypothetical protein
MTSFQVIETANTQESILYCLGIFDDADVGNISVSASYIQSKYSHIQLNISKGEALTLRAVCLEEITQFTLGMTSFDQEESELLIYGQWMITLAKIPLVIQKERIVFFKQVFIYKLILIEKYGVDFHKRAIVFLRERQRKEEEGQRKEDEEKEKKRLKRQRQKEAKKNERWFVRIKSFQAGAVSNEGKQVVKHWKD